MFQNQRTPTIKDDYAECEELRYRAEVSPRLSNSNQLDRRFVGLMARVASQVPIRLTSRPTRI